MRLSDRFAVEDQNGNSVSISYAEVILAELDVLCENNWVILRGDMSPMYIASVAALVRAKVPFLLAGKLCFEQCQDLLSSAGFPQVTVTYLVCLDERIYIEKKVSGISLSDGHGIQCLVTTSGTTGTPKPIVLRTLAILNSIAGIAKVTGWEPWAGKVLHVNNPTFDAFLEEVLLTACAGGTIIVPETPVRLSPLSIPQLIVSEAISAIDLPTGLFNTFASFRKSRVSNSEVVIVIGGQSFVPSAIKFVRDSFPRARIVNSYGPSEATITCSAYGVDANNGGRQIIGKPYPEVIWSVQPAKGSSSTKEGQLMLSGGQLSPSVMNDHDGGWYPTGDRVRVLDNDVLEYLGRMDSVVKIAGIRVDLDVVAKDLEAYLGARVSATSTTSTDGIDSMVVTIYGRPIGSKKRDIQLVRSYLNKRGIPVLVKHANKLPLTDRGKENFGKQREFFENQ